MEQQTVTVKLKRRFKGSRYVICVSCGKTVDISSPDQAWVGSGGWLCATCGRLERAPCKNMLDLVISYKRRMTTAYSVLGELISRADLLPADKVDSLKTAHRILAELLTVSYFHGGESDDADTNSTGDRVRA